MRVKNGKKCELWQRLYQQPISRITVHLGNIYFLDVFWLWMTAIAKLVSPPPRRYLEWCHETGKQIRVSQKTKSVDCLSAHLSIFFSGGKNRQIWNLSTCWHLSRFDFFQQVVGLVQIFYVGSPLGDLNPLSSLSIKNPTSIFNWHHNSPPPKNVDRLISEDIDRYTKDLFLATNLL